MTATALPGSDSIARARLKPLLNHAIGELSVLILAYEEKSDECRARGQSPPFPRFDLPNCSIVDTVETISGALGKFFLGDESARLLSELQALSQAQLEVSKLSLANTLAKGEEVETAESLARMQGFMRYAAWQLWKRLVGIRDAIFPPADPPGEKGADDLVTLSDIELVMGKPKKSTIDNHILTAKKAGDPIPEPLSKKKGVASVRSYGELLPWLKRRLPAYDWLERDDFVALLQKKKQQE